MKWGTGEYGTPGGQVYWSFATSPGNGFGFTDYITDSTYQQLVRNAFQAWENVANIDFVEVPDGAQTDIHLGWDTIDGPFGVVGEARTSGSRSTDTLFSMTEAEIRFDIDENWSTGSAGMNEVGFYQVALHEIGHAIGLNHVSDPNTIMHDRNISGIPGLASGDIQGAQLMYGTGQSTTPPPPPPPPDPDPDPTPDPDPDVMPNPGGGGGVLPDNNPNPNANPTPAPIDPMPPIVVAPEPPPPLVATQSADTFTARAGDEVIDGEGGYDTLQLSGIRSEYTLSLGTDSIVLTDRAGRDGSDTLISIERLDFQSGSNTFGGRLLNIDLFDGVTTLSEDDFSQIIELYIAYFNRAPDAVGLAFWGNAYADGLTIQEMAELFIDQNETRDLYPDSLSNAAFAAEVYNNVLGRVPDQEGFDFWVSVLDEGAVSRDSFILAVLEGARADVPVGATREFAEQVLDDRLYLESKTDLGAYFAVQLGMSDTEDAADVMSIYTGTSGSIIDARIAIEDHHTDALSATNGDFLMPIVGVLDDPFSV